MTVNPAEHKEPGDLPPLSGKEFAVKAKVRFADLSPGLQMILIVLLVCMIVSLNVIYIRTLMENGIVMSGLMLISGAMASAAFFLAYRSAQRAKEREKMHAQANDLLSSLQNLKSRISGQ
ncbi:MAG: hypothetical protein EXR08_03820 [Alphaproteobacteria bacterium]|nr:hypothetical protein [Alphaproteobacteria bacterium]